MISPLENLLRIIFQRLGRETFPWAVLRNYAGLPERIDHDVDLLVENLTAFEGAIREAAHKACWQVVRKVKRQAFLSLYLVPACGCPLSGDSLPAIQIDAWSPFTWKGLTVIPKEVLKGRRLYRSLFYILSPGAEAAVSLIKDLIYHGTVKEKYKPLLPGMVKADRASFVEALNLCLGSQLPWRLAELTIREDWQEIEGLAPRIRRTAIFRPWRHQPVRQTGRWLEFLWGHLRQYFRPTGMFVVLIGPDGSGKSTVAANLQKLLKPLFANQRYYHGHFAILPRLRDLAGLLGIRVHPNSSQQRHNAESMEGSVRFGRLRSLTYLLYYLIDYLLGHWAIFTARGRGELVIFDRYYYDYLIQPSLSLPRWLVRSMMRLVPRPDLVVYLKNNPETILSRKAELTRKELARQGAACEQVLSWLGSGGRVVETVGTPEKTTVKVASILIEAMQKRHYWEEIPK